MTVALAPWIVRLLVRIVVVATLITSLGPAPAQAGPLAWNFEEVLAPGVPAPAPAGDTLDRFFLREIDENGTIHFMAQLSGSQTRYGYYRIENGTLLATRVPGDPVPAPIGGVYSAVWRDCDVASNGVVAFIGDVSGGTAASGLFTWAEGNDTNNFFEGEPAPGTNGGVFSRFLEVEINASGTLVFIAWVSGGTSTSGVFRIDPGGQVEAVALQGQPAPVGGPYQGFYRLALSDSGDVAFTATDGVSLLGTRVVRVSGGVHTVVAVAGDPAPDLPDHTYYHEGSPDEFPNFGAVELGAEGELAFTAALDDCTMVIRFGIIVPVICSVFQQDAGAVHHVLGEDDDGIGRPHAIDIESGIGTLISTSTPNRVQLYDGQALVDVLLDPDVDPDDTWGLVAGSARIGPGGVIAVLARPAGASTLSIWRGVPVVGAPLLAPSGLAVLAAAIAMSVFARRGGR